MTASPRERAKPPEPAGPGLWGWLDVLPILWLVLVISAYALLALYPIPQGSAQRRAEVPGVAELEQAVLPLLASLGVIGIIRYLRSRHSEPGLEPPAPQPTQSGDRNTL